MFQSGLLITAAASTLAGLLFAHVARHVGGRNYSPENRLAGIAFTVAWSGLAFVAIDDGLRVGLGLWGTVDLAAYFAMARLKIIASAAIIWGLGVYVGYLWTGRTRTLHTPLLAFAFSHAALFLYLSEQRGFVGVAVGRWATRLVLSDQAIMPAGWGWLPLVYFFLPPVVIAIAFLLIAPRLEGRLQRYRVVTVAAAILIYQVTNVFHSHPDLSPDAPVWPLLALLNIVAGSLAYAAYAPPRWLERRLGVAKATASA